MRHEPPGPGAGESTAPSQRPLRADAQRNRERIIAAATEVFGETGADASIDDVAQRAGVGVGSIYRSFGNKDALLREVYTSRVLDFIAATRAAAEIADARLAFETYLTTTAAFFAHNRLLIELNQRLNIDPEFSLETCTQRVQLGASIVDRAKSAAILQPHLQFTDIDFMLRAGARYSNHLEAARPGAWQRIIDLVRAMSYCQPQWPADLTPALSEAEYSALILASTSTSTPEPETRTAAPRA